MDPYTDSESDNDAPEEVSLSTARQSTKQAAQSRAQDEAKLKQAAKEKNRTKDARSKANKGKQRAEQAEAAKLAAELAAAQDEEEEDSDEEEEEDETIEPVASTSKHTHLDPDLFKSAAAYYEPAPQPAPGTSKKAQKKAVKQAKREHREMMDERNAQVGEGGQRTVGGTTFQHITSTPSASASLASSATAPATSASKFLNARLYSQRRLVALVSANTAKDAAPSARKRAPKAGRKGGMSDESRRLLGLPVAGDKGTKNDDDDSEDEVVEGKRKKRAMLMKAEGRRTAVGLARPLASARAGGRPAAHFAVASRRQ